MSQPESLDEQIDAAVEIVTSTLGSAVDAVYVYGSAVQGGLRPASDIDLFALVNRRLGAQERRELVERLTPLSDRRLRPDSWRPLEVTVVVRSDLRPWRYPPPTEFQWGEWLRQKFKKGALPERHENPDLVVLLAMVLQTSRPLIGPPASDLVNPVAPSDLKRAMTDSMAGLLNDVDSDTANVLLTLARIWNTMETDSFAPKDLAAEWTLHRSDVSWTRVLERARDVYLGLAEDRWDDLSDEAHLAAERLVEQINRASLTRPQAS